MAVKKTRKGVKKTSVHVRKPSDVKLFERLLKNGGLTLVIVYADWCGHCQRRKSEFNNLMKMSGPKMNVAQVNETILDKTSISNAQINGYPSAILVGNDGKVASFKMPDGTVSNALPKSDPESLNEIVNSANANANANMNSANANMNSANANMNSANANMNSANANMNSANANMNYNNANANASANSNSALIPSSINLNNLPVPPSLEPQANSQYNNSPPDVLEDLVKSQKVERPLSGGSGRSMGLFKQLEMLANNTTRKVKKSLRKLVRRKI